MRIVPIVGLCGGIGSGKSAVSAIFKKLGAVVITADEISKQVLNDPAITAICVSWWGRKILYPGLQVIDRNVLRHIVSGSSKERKRLDNRQIPWHGHIVSL